MLNCIIVDDEQPAINALTPHVAACGQLRLLHTTTNPAEALALVDQEPVDLAFLDIQMPGMNGMELARALKGKCKVIFTTGHSEFVSDAFDMEGHVVDYLMKPVGLPRFVRAVQRAINSLGHCTPPNTQQDWGNTGLEHDYIFIKGEQKNKMQQLYLTDIDYVEAQRNYMAIYHGGQKTMVLVSMKEMEASLPAQHFARVQKSFIVALHKIAAVAGNKITLKTRDVEIAIGRRYKARFAAAIKGRVVEP